MRAGFKTCPAGLAFGAGVELGYGFGGSWGLFPHEALEEPDFAEIGPKPARHDGQRGPRSGQGGVPLSAKEPLLPAHWRPWWTCSA